MAQSVIQTSFNSGEWAPALYSRVDLTKYHSGATLIRNFFVDYRGGATTRPGTRFVARAKSTTIRLIPFQASFTVTYILEFGPGYVRFYNNGAPVLEAAIAITSATNANPGVFTKNAHGYSNGDWVVASGFSGGTWGSNLNGNTYIVAGATANTFTLTDLYGVAIDTTGYGAFSAGNTSRVYTLTSGVVYGANDLFGIKYAQNVNQLFLCHPNYPPQVLTLNTATNWSMAAISFAPTIATPTGLAVAVTTAGSSFVSYTVTAVDSNGQESSPATPVTINNGGTGSTQNVSWSAVSGAVAYNVYRTIFSAVTTPSGQPYGFIGTSTGLHFLDQNITANFAETQPIVTNPFSGSGVATLTLTAMGTGYTSVPTVSFSGGGPTTSATANCYLGVISQTLNNGGLYTIDPTGYGLSFGNGVVITITSALPSGGNFVANGGVISNPGTLVSGSTPTNPVAGSHPYLDGFTVSKAKFNLTWGVTQINLTSPGAGYGGVPTVVFSSGAASATATLGAASAGNPTVPGFYQQRSFFGGPSGSPSQLNMSQPGAPYNFNVTFPVQADNAIQETLTNTTLNSIKSVLPVSAGLIVFTDKGAWLLNGGSPGSAISAIDIVANPQAYSGASDLPPIATPTDVLYVQAKNSIIRDLAFNFYLNNYVGTDISILSSHLFYGFNLIQWAWAEEPFKLVWAIRNDGTMLTLTFSKEQELVAWAHSDTNGAYVSVASVNEQTSIGNVDAVYVAAQRSVNSQTVVYIERMVELTYPSDYKSSWQVDAGIGYNGAAATTFSGAQHLAGLTVTGVADGTVINFVMPSTGTFVFGPGGTTGLTGIANASIVTVGLAFSPQLTTLPLDLGEPTVQGKRKKITGLTALVQNALGLWAGRNLTTVVQLADTTIGNVGTMSNTTVTGLVTGEVRLILDPQWDVYGQYSITQPNPYPASILGVVPEIEVGDDK